MKKTAIDKIKTKDEARQVAIAWQSWASKRDMSYVEISQRLNYFEKLAKKFRLKGEFKENGII
jgi:hypothetical protein